ncbi:MAG: tetratricopeptide repeat protein [Planctomycetota bacterium]|nr:MAG: tetratricopeptide repeat protein [Planctomycetota bacterium]
MLISLAVVLLGGFFAGCSCRSDSDKSGPPRIGPAPQPVIRSTPRSTVGSSTVGEPRPAWQPPVPDSFQPLREELLGLAHTLRAAWPDAPEGVDLEASMHDRFGSLDAATRCWEEWQATHPDSAEAELRLGKFAKERGDDAGALEHLQAAFDRSPELPGAQVLLGESLTAAGRASDAVAVLSRELPSTAGNPNRLALLGHAHLQAGNYVAAREAFNRVLAIDPSYTQAIYGLGTASARLGLAEESKAYFADFARRKEKSLAADRATAVNRLDDLPALHSAAANWYAVAGKIAASRGDMGSAESYWRRSLAFAPGQRDARGGLAELLRRQGRDTEAIQVRGQ